MSIASSLNRFAVRLLPGVAVLAGGCATPDLDSQVTGALDLVPADAATVIVVEDLAALHENLDVPAIAAAHPELMTRVGRGFRTQLGFDPLDLESWRASGADPAAAAAIAFLDTPPGATVVVLPGDGALLAERMAAVHGRRGTPPAEVERHRGVPIIDASRSSTTWLPLGRYLVVVAGIVRNDERIQLARRILDEVGSGALSALPAFARARDGLPGSRDVFVYLGAGGTEGGSTAVLPGYLELPAILFGGGPHRGAGVAFSFAPDRVTVDARSSVPESPLRTLVAPDAGDGTSFLQRISGDPILHLELHLDGAEGWRMLRARGGNEGFLHWIVSSAQKHLGVDLDTELFAHAGQRVGIIVDRLALMGSDIVLHLAVDDVAAVDATLDRIARALDEGDMRLPMLGTRIKARADKVGSVTFHRIPIAPFAELCAGTVDGRLVVTTTRPRFARLAGDGTGDDPENPSPTNVLSRLPDNAARDALSRGPLAFVNADPQEVARTLSALPVESGRVAAVAAALRRFDVVVGDVDLEDHIFTVNLRLSSNTPGVWLRLVDEIVAGFQSGS